MCESIFTPRDSGGAKAAKGDEVIKHEYVTLLLSSPPRNPLAEVTD